MPFVIGFRRNPKNEPKLLNIFNDENSTIDDVNSPTCKISTIHKLMSIPLIHPNPKKSI